MGLLYFRHNSCTRAANKGTQTRLSRRSRAFPVSKGNGRRGGERRIPRRKEKRARGRRRENTRHGRVASRRRRGEATFFSLASMNLKLSGSTICVTVFLLLTDRPLNIRTRRIRDALGYIHTRGGYMLRAQPSGRRKTGENMRFHLGAGLRDYVRTIYNNARYAEERKAEEIR